LIFTKPIMTMAISFERYDEEFESLCGQIESNLAKVSSSDIESGENSSSNSSSHVKMATTLLAQCDDLIKQMSVEARGSNDKELKKEYLQKVRVCKARYANLKDDVASAQNELDRSSLLSSSSKRNVGDGNENGAKARLLSTNEQLAAQNDTLDRARRVMAETEGVALEITDELGRNREKIASAHSRVRDVSGLTNRARRILRNMQRREVQQKMALYGIGIVLVIVVIVVLKGI